MTTQTSNIPASQCDLSKLMTDKANLLEALNEINNWLVCSAIATPEDMAQSFGYMQGIAENAITKATNTPFKDTGVEAGSDEAIGCQCSVCFEWQRWTPSGMVCKNGHGGAPGINRKLFTTQHISS